MTGAYRESRAGVRSGRCERAARRPPPPFLYFILFLPFGATTAFVSLTVVNIWSQDKTIGEAALGAMVAMNILPHTFKVLWAPIVDTVWNGRAWYIVGNLVSSAAILATGFVPVSKGNMGLLTGLVLLNGFATTFVGMTTEALMAHVCPPEQRGWRRGGRRPATSAVASSARSRCRCSIGPASCRCPRSSCRSCSRCARSCSSRCRRSILSIGRRSSRVRRSWAATSRASSGRGSA